MRLKRFLEMRGADCGPLAYIPALPALWVGLLYDDAALTEADALTADWTMEDVVAMRDAVPTQGLGATIGGRQVLDVAREAVAISVRGLKARAKLNANGDDESIFLSPLDAVLARRATLAEGLLALYSGAWNRSVEPVFGECRY